MASPRPSQFEHEHQLQIQLLDALCDSDAASASDLLDRLIALTELHFLSEELLMRLRSYDAYDDHAQAHADMMVRLQALRDRPAGTDLDAEAVIALRQQLVQHMQQADVAFASQQAG